MSGHTMGMEKARAGTAKFIRAMSDDPMVRAADDMLEALTRLIARWDSAGLGAGDESLIEICRAAIAKAEVKP